MRTLFRRQISRSTGDLNALREFAKLFCPGRADSDTLERNCQSCYLENELGSSCPEILDSESSSNSSFYKEGYLHALISDVWLRSFVVLQFGLLEVYSDESKDHKLVALNIIGCQVHIPNENEIDEVMKRFYPLKLVLKNLSTFTLCARSFDERRDWTEAIRHASSEPDTRSLNIEGLNLECGQLSKETKRPLYEKKDDALFRKRKALYELRRETAELQDACRKQLTCHDWNQRLASIDNKYDRAFVSTQQEALRKATLLRQRKISTQLKIDTLKKQLPSGSHRPKSRQAPPPLASVEENRRGVENQLEELTGKLQQIEGVLGDTERKAILALQKLDIRRKEEVQSLRTDSPCVVREERLGKLSEEPGWPPKESDFLPRICLSMSADDCTASGSQSRSKRALPSPARRKHFADVIKSTSSVPSLIFSSTKGLKQQQQESHSSSSKEDMLNSMQDSGSASAVLRPKKSRKSPLKAFGNFVDNRLLRRWRVEKRTRSADLTPPSEHQECDDPFGDSDMRPRASTFSMRARLPTMSTSSNSDPFIHCVGESTRSGTASLESHSSGEEELLGEKRTSSVMFALDRRSTESRELDNTDEESGAQSLSSSQSEKKESQVAAGGSQPELRTEINPDTLAEIEAFEIMAQDYLRHHQREQVTT